MPIDRELASGLIARAKAKGASQGDVTVVEHEGVGVKVRLGKVETVSQAHETRLGLRLFFGRSSAATSTSDMSRASLDRLLDQTCAMARPRPRTSSAVCRNPGSWPPKCRSWTCWTKRPGACPWSAASRPPALAEDYALQYDERITNSRARSSATRSTGSSMPIRGALPASMPPLPSTCPWLRWRRPTVPWSATTGSRRRAGMTRWIPRKQWAARPAAG